MFAGDLRTMHDIIMSLFFKDCAKEGLTIKKYLFLQKKINSDIFFLLICADIYTLVRKLGIEIILLLYFWLVQFKFVGTPLPPTGDLEMAKQSFTGI